MNLKYSEDENPCESSKKKKKKKKKKMMMRGPTIKVLWWSREKRDER